jgi:hypothetical protein
MSDIDESIATRAVIVASTTKNFAEVSNRVALNGGIAFAVRNSVDALLPIVRNAVRHAVSVIPDLDWPHSETAADARPRLAALYEIARNRDIVRAINGIAMQSGDLDVAQRTLTALDSALSEYTHFDDAHHKDDWSASGIVDALGEAFSGLADPQYAIAVLQTAVEVSRRILDLQSTPSYRIYKSAILSHPDIISQRNEIVEAIDWAYGNLEHDED